MEQSAPVCQWQVNIQAVSQAGGRGRGPLNLGPLCSPTSNVVCLYFRFPAKCSDCHGAGTVWCTTLHLHILVVGLQVFQWLRSSRLNCSRPSGGRGTSALPQGTSTSGQPTQGGFLNLVLEPAAPSRRRHQPKKKRAVSVSLATGGSVRTVLNQEQRKEFVEWREPFKVF